MPQVDTASGPVAADGLGLTLMHEHLFINLMPEYRATGLLNNAPLIAEELAPFAAAGGRTVVDVTPAELTRGAAPAPAGGHGVPANGGSGPSRAPENVLAVQQLAKETGVQVVLGTGHYRDPYLDSGWLDEHGVDQVAEQLVRDIEYGFPGTDVRAGIIGEVGCDKWFVSAREERSFRAAARACQRTNLAVTTHAARWPVGSAQLDVLREEGVDPGRVIIGHCDSVAIPDYHLDLARRGAYVQFDLLRGAPRLTEQAVGFVLALVRQGFLEQVLLSHDVCTTEQLVAGGGAGFAFVPTTFAERLREAGLSDDELRMLLVDNPRRALSGQ